MAKSKTPDEPGTIQKIGEFITEKDKFGQSVKWNMNGQK